MIKKHKTPGLEAESVEIGKCYSFLKQAGYPLLTIDQNRVLWASEEAADLLKVNSNTLPGKTITSFLPGADSFTSMAVTETIKGTSDVNGQTIHITAISPEPDNPELKLLFLQQAPSTDATETTSHIEKMHEAVIHQMYDGLIVIQHDRVQFLNPQLARLVGYSMDEIKGELFSKFIHPDELSRVMDYYRRRLTGEEVPREYETCLLGKDGRKIDIALHAGLIPYEGELADFVVVRDLSREKAMQQSLFASEERFSAILQNLSEMIWIADADGTITFESPSTQKILGYESGWLTGRNGFNYIHPDDLESTILALSEVDLNEQPGEPTEFRFRHKDGHWVFLEALGQNLKNVPAINGLVLTIRDITERKQAESQLHHSEERYHNIVDLAPDGIITANQSGVITSCNQAFLQLSGYQLEDIVGKHFTRLPTLAKQDIEEYAALLKAIFQGSIQRSYEFRWKHADGSRRWGEAHVSLMHSSDGARQLQAIVQDTTEKKRTEMLFQALEQASLAIAAKNTPQEIYQTLAEVFSRIGISSMIFLFDEENYCIRPAYLGPSRKTISIAEKLARMRIEDYTLSIQDFYPFENIIRYRTTTYHTTLEDISQKALPGVPSAVIQKILQLFGYTRLIAAPIITENKTTGILCVFADNMLERDTSAISLFAQQLSSALEKATLLEQARAELSHRTRAEQALRESEARLLSLINAFPEPTYLIDLNDSVLAANHSFITATGKDSTQVLNHSIYDLLPKKIAEERRITIDQVKKTGKGIAYEDSRGKRDFINYIHPVLDIGKNLSRIAVFSVDITDQKQNEVRIKRLLDRQISLTQISVALSAQNNTEQIYDLICEHLRNSLDVLSFQVSLYQPEVSLLQTEFLHYQGKTLDPRAVQPVHHDENSSNLQSQVIQTGAPVYLTTPKSEENTGIQEMLQTEAAFQHPDLTEYKPEIIKSLLLTPMKIGGITIGILQISSMKTNAYDQADIEFLSALSGMTAIAIQNSKLLAHSQRQTQQVQQIIRSVPEGVILLSSDYEIILTNPAANSFLDILGRADPGDPLQKLGNRTIEEILEQPPEGLWHEIALEEASQPRFFEGLARPLSSVFPAEEWVLVLREVTQEREIQQRIQQQERLAAVGQLAAGIAHDFNNIMVPIILYAEMMRESADLAEELKERVEIILKQSHRAASLTQQILDFSRRSMIESIPLSLKPFLKEMKRLLERTLPENIHIELKILVEEPVILADVTRMQQVFLNLALNAKDAMPDGGTLSFILDKIEITADVHPPLPNMPPQKWLRISISDNGTGIPEKDLPHIFEPFFTTKEPDKGSGLGLAQVYGIIKQHNGFIDVESQISSGTRFVIYMPAYNQPAEYRSKSAVSFTNGNGEKVLIVEDDQAVRDAVGEVLSRLNYSSILAESSTRAVEIYRQCWKEISIVLSDLVMPGLGGLELLKQLQEINPAVKMVVMSGYPLAENESIREEHTVAAWIQKPVQIQSVSEAIQAALAFENN
ncbi:MAG: PAS domain S-box protein [Anaerolineales bacterium]|nr:PAS domain S-box protein [Anaerolineales bacterium]